MDVDYPSLPLSKFAASIVKDLPIGSLFSKLSLSDTDINDLLTEYSIAMSDAAEPEPYFRAACNWVKANYDIWSDWLDRLPLCTFEDHIVSHVTGCENGSTVRKFSSRGMYRIQAIRRYRTTATEVWPHYPLQLPLADPVSGSLTTAGSGPAGSI